MDNGYQGQERRATILLSEEQLDAIAERAAEKVLNKFHLEIGKLTVRAVMYLLGAAGIALAGWLGLEKVVK